MGEGYDLKTEDFSILDLYEKPGEQEVLQSFYQDLNLLQVIDKLTAKWGRDVRQYYRYLPGTLEEVEYRRAIYGDIKKEAVYTALMDYTHDMEKVWELRREKERVLNSMQKYVWHVREIAAYCSAYEALEAKLDKAGLSSEGMTAFLRILKEIMDSGGYRSLKEEILTLLAKIKGLRFIITYDKDRISVSPGEIEGNGAYEEMLRKESGREPGRLQNPFRADPHLSELESACLEILEKKSPEFFAELKNTAGRNTEYELPVLKRFEKEVIFYLSYATLTRDMQKAGFEFSAPVTAPEGTMEANGLYDLALALTSLTTGKKVIANDLAVKEGERFFVLTGPNQGGKTTFARSLGQLVYFARVGLDVPAVSASVPFFPEIQTHFSVEESVETGRGKLKEELVRLAPMMEENKRGTFVIINELFTTAASYDAVIMGKKVLEHFIGLGCMGIYVTHLKELAEGHEGIVSLRAMLNDERKQTFKIMRGEALDTACAENVVNKYRLTYDQLKERL